MILEDTYVFFSRLNALLVNGNWSEWVDGPCSKTCALGVMKRTRTCSNPEPFCGGSPCLGVDEVDAECLVVECDRELNIHIVCAVKTCTTFALPFQLQLVESLMQLSLLKDKALQSVKMTWKRTQLPRQY